MRADRDVLTTGGDAPGMNAAIRAAVDTGIDKGWEMFGVRHGYAGLVKRDFVKLGLRDVGGIILLGGTMLRQLPLSGIQVRRNATRRHSRFP